MHDPMINGVEMKPAPYGTTGLTQNVDPPKTSARDYENSKYVAVPSMDIEQGDNLGIEHYDLCFVAKLTFPPTQSELDALGRQENGGRPIALDDSLNREIHGPLTGPLKAKGAESKEEPHHATLHQIDNLVKRMHSVGLETRKYLSLQNDEVFLLLRAPIELLRALAEATDFLVECNPEKLKEVAGGMETLFPGRDIKNFAVPEESELLDGDSYYPPYKHVYMPYRDETKPTNSAYRGLWKEYKTQHMGRVPFGMVARIKLTRDILSRRGSEGGCEMDLLHFDEDPKWSLFPLHSDFEREALKKEWLQRVQLSPTWMQPVVQMQYYLGEQVTLYFAFLGSHCRWLFLLGLVGLVVEVVETYYDDDQNLVAAWYALVVALWAACFIEFWKRREATLQMHFGMSNFEKSEEVRVKFINDIKGQKVKHPVTGELEYAPRPYYERLRKRIISASIIGLSILVILCINVVVYWFKSDLKNSDNELVATYYKYIFSIILAITISVINKCYVPIAKHLTEWENHRTATEHQDSLIYKQFAVKFISSYASLTYTAFFENKVEGGCDGETCIDNLKRLVGTILVQRLIFTIIFDNVLPKVKSARSFKKETEGTDMTKMTTAEKQYILVPFDYENEIMARFLDQVLLFGYMVLFVIALPLAPFVGYFSNMLQINQYGSLLLFHKQRCMPFGAQDIGSFQKCFEFIAFVATFTNAGLVFFTMEDAFFSEDFPHSYVMWLFFATVFTVLVCTNMLRDNLDEVPFPVATQLERQTHLRRKVVDLTPDEGTHDLKPVSFSDEEHKETAKVV